MQLAAHLALKRVVDDLMLLHPRFAAEGFGNDRGRVMVAVTREVAYRHLRIRNAGSDQPLDIACSHCHGRLPISTYGRDLADSSSLGKVGDGAGAIYCHNSLLASRAPSTRAWSFAQAICGWMRPPNPQSVPAMTFSRPTMSA